LIAVTLTAIVFCLCLRRDVAVDDDGVVVVDVSLAMAVVACKDGGAAHEREDQKQGSYTMTHSNILSSDFGLGRAVRQSDCQEMRIAKPLITKG
jgi:hypothetical protein